MPAQPNASTMRERPGPEVAVALRAPVRAAPVAMVIAESSSSVCTTTTDPVSPLRSLKVLCPSRKTLSSVAGLMG